MKKSGVSDPEAEKKFERRSSADDLKKPQFAVSLKKVDAPSDLKADNESAQKEEGEAETPAFTVKLRNVDTKS